MSQNTSRLFLSGGSLVVLAVRARLSSSKQLKVCCFEVFRQMLDWHLIISKVVGPKSLSGSLPVSLRMPSQMPMQRAWLLRISSSKTLLSSKHRYVYSFCVTLFTRDTNIASLIRKPAVARTAHMVVSTHTRVIPAISRSSLQLATRRSRGARTKMPFHSLQAWTGGR